MAKKTITGASLQPMALKVAKVSFGVAAQNPDVAIDVSTGFATAANVLFTLPVGAVVSHMVINKRVAFGSTGAFTMDIGDTDTDGYFASAGLVASDTGVRSSIMNGGSTGGAHTSAYGTGRVYTSDDDLNIGVSIGTAKINAGVADAYLFYFIKEEA